MLFFIFQSPQSTFEIATGENNNYSNKQIKTTKNKQKENQFQELFRLKSLYFPIWLNCDWSVIMLTFES